MHKFKRTDLAEERRGAKGIKIDGIEYRKKSAGDFVLSYLDIKSQAGEELIGKPMGRYVTLSHPDLSMLGEADFILASNLAASELRQMAEAKCGKKVGGGFSILAVGIGNGQVFFDSLGCAAVDLIREDSLGGEVKILKFIPRSSAQNGIETFKLVRAVACEVRPDVIVAVDSIMAGAVERLGRTVQFSDSGICPGSGVGSEQGAISLDTIGVPIISVGIPSVSDAETVFCHVSGNADENPGGGNSDKLKNFLVIPSNFELMQHTLPCLVASAIEKAFSTIEIPGVIYGETLEYT